MVQDNWIKGFPADLKNGCGSTSADPYFDEASYSNKSKSPEKFYLIGLNRWGVRVPDNCELVYEEKRVLRGQDFVMCWVSLCDSKL
jgi:hypothetical protein